MTEQYIDDANDLEIRLDEESTAGYVATLESAAGAVLAGSGVLFAPVTLGTSLILTGAGLYLIHDAYQTMPQAA